MKYSSHLISLSTLLFATAGPAFAKNCGSSGALSYVGRTQDSSRSVWLSTVDPGNSALFNLEAAQGNTLVDTFGSRGSGGTFRHLSISPFVSNGNGGTHKLYDATGDCLLDTQNQKGGIVFPGFPTRPPGGVRPPIGILPPPGGLTPGLPGGVTPPIGTLPPTGLMPGLPVVPSPPIAVLPPTGITPELPGAVKPPIAVLPPGGGGGTGGGGGGTGGGSPGGGGGTSGGQPDPGGLAALQTTGTSSTASAGMCSANLDDDPYRTYCDPHDSYAGQTFGPPLTEGRDLGPPSPWNVWVDSTYVGTRDDRSLRDQTGQTTSIGAGADYAVSPGSIVGMQVLWNQSSAETEDDAFRQDTAGVAIGPYAAISLNQNWALYGSLTWGRYDTDIDLLTLNGSFKQDEVAADVTLTGQYVYDSGSYLRPQIALNYVRADSPDYTLAGSVNGSPVSIRMDGSTSDYGTFAPTVEYGRIFADQGNLWVPYAELGAIYEFLQSDDPNPLAEDSSHDWSGTVRGGLRVRTDRSFYADVSVGYLSAFQPGLDVFEASLYLAWSF